MLLLSAVTAILIIVFNGYSHALVPLFAVGAFLIFALSQAGMVEHWRRIHGRHWQIKSLINGLGAITTLPALLIKGASKFYDGALFTFILIPVGAYTFLRIRQHYRDFDTQMLPGSIEHILKWADLWNVPPYWYPT